MREIVTILRDAQERIMNQTGKSVDLAVFVTDEMFRLAWAENGGPGRPYDYMKSFELNLGLGVITIARDSAVVV